jgi:tellurite resistance protein
MVLGLAGLGQAWRFATRLWHVPDQIGEMILLVAGLIWAGLLLGYLVQTIRRPYDARSEFEHPVQGATPALIGIATLLMVPAIRPYSIVAGGILLALGTSWHLLFAFWHTGRGWQSGRDVTSISPTVYLPTVAGNFTGGAAFGAMGLPDVGWCFLGAGLFSWLALESIVLQRLWQSETFPIEQRASIGVHFAPPAVAGAAWLSIAPGTTDHWVIMLWGYGLFQLALGLRLIRWLRAQPFSRAYWSFTFGISSTAVLTVKLALAGVTAAAYASAAVLLLATMFEGYLLLRTIAGVGLATWAAVRSSSLASFVSAASGKAKALPR